MAQFQVVCITLHNPNDPNSGITQLGTADIPDGTRRLWTRDQVIAAIDSGAHQFYTFCNNNWAHVFAVHPPYGPAYVQTAEDQQWCNNLLSLPYC
jgi:hypothetical protein